jgi:hypothetical protein
LDDSEKIMIGSEIDFEIIRDIAYVGVFADRGIAATGLKFTNLILFKPRM